MRLRLLLATLLMIPGIFLVVGRLRSEPEARAWRADVAHSEPLPTPRSIRDGWFLRHVITLEEPVNSLMAGDDAVRDSRGRLFAGLEGTGSIHRFPTMPGYPAFPVARHLGDVVSFGSCNVNRMAEHDVDGDGVKELLGSTSQITPRGRPRLYLWDNNPGPPLIRAVARPAIASSWSHSLGFLPRSDDRPDSIFVTFCGFGEVVEYRLGERSGLNGFGQESMTWKVVGQLPASGEWLQVADVDSDGDREICVATGFAVGKAAIHFYDSPAAGAPLVLEGLINEGGRFGNVRFLVGDFRGEGRADVLAWWCTDLAGGDGEIILYRMAAGWKVESRTLVARGPAARFWTDDNRFVAGDTDGDGRDEVWFAGLNGKVFRFDAARDSAPELILEMPSTCGPLEIGREYLTMKPQVYLAWSRSVFALEAPEAAPPARVAGPVSLRAARGAAARGGG